ncbi:MAG: enoyl-CoA hydratase/isomerase family protein [Chromatiales bacterium]|nr:enoyl-CoA hydratase/isomerase family protein [Chromatiales bacterium]
MLATEHQDGVAVIRMQRPPANALDHALVDALRGTIARESGRAQALVLTGLPGMFSGGLDVPALVGQDRAAIRGFWGGFFSLMHELAACPVPVVAALSGHAPAGGAVLALCCDRRIAASGRFRMGLNEVQVGLPVPPAILSALTRLTGEARGGWLALRGELLNMDEALAAGLVDELVEPGLLDARALELATGLLGLPPRAMNETRLAAKAGLIAALRGGRDAELATEYWFSEETQAGMRALVARLSRR